jgi:hypothetical protein
MRIQVRTVKVALTTAQRSQVELQLGLALGRFGDRIHRVVGRFRDEGGNGVRDIHCRVDVDLSPRKISVEESDVSPVLAARRAAARASRSVARALERERRLDQPLGGTVGVLGGPPMSP